MKNILLVAVLATSFALGSCKKEEETRPAVGGSPQVPTTIVMPPQNHDGAAPTIIKVGQNPVFISVGSFVSPGGELMPKVNITALGYDPITLTSGQNALLRSTQVGMTDFTLNVVTQGASTHMDSAWSSPGGPQIDSGYAALIYYNHCNGAMNLVQISIVDSARTTSAWPAPPVSGTAKEKH